MNTSMTSTPGRAPWFRIAASAWLLLLSACLAVVALDVLRLDAAPEPSPQARQFEAMATRLSHVEQQLTAIKRQAPPLSQEALATARAELDTRIAQIESTIAARSDDPALQALRQRVEKLEAIPAPAKVATPVPRPKPTPAKPAKSPSPPFQIMGVELRGGERFLTVAPLGAASLGQMRLLRTGESEGSWTLESIGAKQATFRVDGKPQQVVVP